MLILDLACCSSTSRRTSILYNGFAN